MTEIRPPSPLSRAEVLALLDAARDGTPHGVRNAAMIAIMWRMGLRIKSLLTIGEIAVDWERMTLTQDRAKGGKRIVLGLDGTACEHLRRWMPVRARYVPQPGSPLFCRTTIGCPSLTVQRAGAILKALAARAGIVKRVHPHGLRHTCALELYREGVPVPMISQILGHANIQTTWIYLRKLCGENDTIAFMQSRPLDSTPSVAQSRPASVGMPVPLTFQAVG